MSRYFHSVTLDNEKCKGCTNCIKHCPTEAIRVREGKARIFEERCIDCGECIRICPNNAKIAVTDDLSRLQDFQYRIALPAPSLFGQFKSEVAPGAVLGAMLQLGFNSVLKVAVGADVITSAICQEILHGKTPKPLISSACPAVVRLMQVRFPGLLPNLIPVKAPMDVAARMAKEAAANELNLPHTSIGAFFITPCPAKVTAVKQPFYEEFSLVDGVFSMSTIYGELLQHVKQKNADSSLHRATGLGMGWGMAGGENAAISSGSLLSVDGIYNVIEVLEQIEKGGLDEIDYLEAQACVGGCVGGPLVVQNPFVSRVLIRKMAGKYSKKHSLFTEEQLSKMADDKYFTFNNNIQPRPVIQLDADIGRALSKKALLEETVQHLPGLDCGFCGSPNCRALAEDIVREFALETDCIFKLRERVRSLASEMVELAQKEPPAMGRIQSAGHQEIKEKLLLGEVAKALEATIYGDLGMMERHISGAYCSDLLNDALAPLL